jgi:phosphopantothenoylcysteine decarboxylase/phosphopantothenate--cysteine ligase
MTSEAQRFLTPMTLEALSQQPVYTDIFRLQEGGMPHISLALDADLVLVAPVTAHTLAKAAHGLADDLLSTLLLTTPAPVMMAPAMDGGMIDHPAVKRNMDLLRERGVVIVGPIEGPLASGAVGPGRMAGWEEIVEAVVCRLHPQKDLAGQTILISAGPTLEPLDPVRYLSNRSSGKMGYAVATEAKRRGATVILVTGPTHLAPPPGVEMVSVVTAQEMADAVFSRIDRVSAVVMAAAVADFRPEETAEHKIKKGERLTLSLVQNPDILLEIARRRGQGRRPIVIGFAAESRELKAEALRKLKEKDLDLIVANSIVTPGSGFDSDTNQVTFFSRDGKEEGLPLLPKSEVAARLLDRVADLLSSA